MKLLYKAILIFVIVAISDISIGKISDYVFLNLPDNSAKFSNIYQSLFKKEADILIIGASTARHHYDAKFLSDTLRTNVYNAGMYGFDIVYADMVLESFLNRCKPQKVILDIGSTGYLNGKLLNRINNIKYYYGSNPAVTKYFQRETDWQQNLKFCSSLYRYNKTFEVFRSIKAYPDTLNGFEPLSARFDELKCSLTNDFEVDSVDYRALVHIVDLCREYSSQLYIVLAPSLYTDMIFEKWLLEFCAKHQVKYIDAKNDPYWNQHHELFRDEAHLNAKGAAIFSRKIVSSL